jgi:hypothetical protein
MKDIFLTQLFDDGTVTSAGVLVADERDNGAPTSAITRSDAGLA